MTPATHLHLKRPTGWFAAGREIQQALTLLSDASFKLFVWLCLHAERGRGSLTASPKQLAAALHKTEPELQSALDELFQQVLAWGGVITGEHGIGLAKKRWWPEATGDVARDVHRAIKDALDPAGILNPGKFLD